MLDRTSASLLVCARVVIVCTIVQVPGGREMPEAMSAWPCPWAARVVTTAGLLHGLALDGWGARLRA
jgi:hypothetical protein